MKYVKCLGRGKGKNIIHLNLDTKFCDHLRGVFDITLSDCTVAPIKVKKQRMMMNWTKNQVEIRFVEACNVFCRQCGKNTMKRRKWA